MLDSVLIVMDKVFLLAPTIGLPPTEVLRVGLTEGIRVALSEGAGFAPKESSSHLPLAQCILPMCSDARNKCKRRQSRAWPER